MGTKFFLTQVSDRLVVEEKEVICKTVINIPLTENAHYRKV